MATFGPYTGGKGAAQCLYPLALSSRYHYTLITFDKVSIENNTFKGKFQFKSILYNDSSMSSISKGFYSGSNVVYYKLDVSLYDKDNNLITTKNVIPSRCIYNPGTNITNWNNGRNWGSAFVWVDLYQQRDPSWIQTFPSDALSLSYNSMVDLMYAYYEARPDNGDSYLKYATYAATGRKSYLKPGGISGLFGEPYGVRFATDNGDVSGLHSTYSGKPKTTYMKSRPVDRTTPAPMDISFTLEPNAAYFKLTLSMTDRGNSAGSITFPSTTPAADDATFALDTSSRSYQRLNNIWDNTNGHYWKYNSSTSSWEKKNVYHRENGQWIKK